MALLAVNRSFWRGPGTDIASVCNYAKVFTEYIYSILQIFSSFKFT